MAALLVEVESLRSDLALLDTRVSALESPERNYP